MQNMIIPLILGLLLAVSLVALWWMVKQLQSKTPKLDESERDVFKSLAASALEGNSKLFLEMARQALATQVETAKGDLEKRQQSIEGMVKPIKDTLEKYQTQLRQMELDRHKTFTTIENELKRVVETGSALSTETRALKDALKKPHVRGRWGEIQLKNCVELSGMSEYCDFVLQDVTKTNDGNSLRPDMIVRMPGGRVVVVDSKVPLDAFLSALEANTEEKRTTETQRHGRQVKEHVTKLATKAYQEHVSDAADFTVMFLPNESFLYAALESQPDLVEYALEKKILIATPPTFVGLLKVVRHGWTEEKLAQNAQEISRAGAELHKRLVDFVETFEDIGRHIKKANEHYEAGKARLNSRVLVQARRMESLGIRGNKELPENAGFNEIEIAHEIEKQAHLV
jgi:DNA recombination protein RmuC